MKLKKQFEEFYAEIKIDRDEEGEELIEKRNILQSDLEGNLPDIMGEHDIELKKSDIDIFDQGSYKLNTTIATEPYDRDVAIMIPLNIEDYPDTRAIKGYIRDALIHTNRTLVIKEPCVNVSYIQDGEEWMHIDLPVYASYNGNVYLARGREFATEGNYGWELSDPKGLNEWMLAQITGKDQLRRIVRYIKKWKYEKYKNTSESKKNQIPPSIGLTLLAFDCFAGCTSSDGDDDLLSLQNTISNIISKFSLTYNASGEIIKAEITRTLPVIPCTDVFTKMKNRDCYGVTFYNRLNTALQNLTDAVNESSEHDAGVSVQKVFGDEFVAPAKETSSSFQSSKKEHSFG